MKKSSKNKFLDLNYLELAEFCKLLLILNNKYS
uniref:Uncharacterized protein n=1 Tax=viral metagenome TaxID=1070528 RepID=A0A6C0D163_9ZZZZ